MEEYQLFPSAAAAPVQQQQHRASTAVHATAVHSDDSHDDDDAFHLFGAPPVSAASGAAPAIAAATLVTPAHILAQPESPPSYELFPMAALSSSAAAPTATVMHSELASERVAELPTKDAPVQFTRATAPLDEAGGAEPPAVTRKAVDEVVEDHEFVLFPTSDATFPPPETAASLTASQYSTSAGSASYAESPSVASVAAAAMAAAGTPLSPAHKMSGNAVDIIAVRSTEDQYFTTPWHVVFGWSRFKSNITTGVGDMVRVFVNGKELPTKMQLLERGRCVFVTGGLTPPVGDLLFTELSDERPNLVRFEHYQKSTETFRYVESRLHVWGPNESVVVADLDGTLTISDVEGHIRTLRLGQYDFLHKGACDFFMKLHELQLRIVYLTARPIDWATASRTHLENATQHAHALPPGPLITNSNGLTGALLTEVVNKNPHIFKAQVLNEIQLTLIHAGRVTEHPVFVAGFGNRPTDVVAYEAVGMDPALIFLLDPYSNLKASSDPRLYESYSDPNALLWLLPRLKHRVPIEKVARIDDYTVRELVLAEDREQLLMAERQARALQEQEFERARQSGALGGGGGGGSVFSRALYGS